MPSPATVRRAAVVALRRHWNGQPIVDLGSGFGGLARTAAAAVPGGSVVGIERSLIPFLYAATTNALRGPENVRFVRASFESLKLSDATTYLCYLSPGSMSRLRRQYERDRPRNGVLVACVFAMPGWTPADRIECNDALAGTVYVYRY